RAAKTATMVRRTPTPVRRGLTGTPGKTGKTVTTEALGHRTDPRNGPLNLRRIRGDHSADSTAASCPTRFRPRRAAAATTPGHRRHPTPPIPHPFPHRAPTPVLTHRTKHGNLLVKYE